MIAQEDDPELPEFGLATASQEGGGFVSIRPLLIALRAKYTKYEPSAEVKAGDPGAIGDETVTRTDVQSEPFSRPCREVSRKEIDSTCPRCGHVHQGDKECGEPMGGGRICRCEMECVPA